MKCEVVRTLLWQVECLIASPSAQRALVILITCLLRIVGREAVGAASRELKIVSRHSHALSFDRAREGCILDSASLYRRKVGCEVALRMYLGTLARIT